MGCFLASVTTMANRRLLAVIILAAVAAVAFNAGSDFVGARKPDFQSTMPMAGVIGKDSQGRYRFLVDGVVPEPPSTPKGSSFGETMVGALIVIEISLQLSKLCITG